MSDYKPMTSRSRQFFLEGAQQMIQENVGGSPAANKAEIILRYEATLRAKDAQIAALVKAISQRCVDDQACIFADELLAAIKEASNG